MLKKKIKELKRLQEGTILPVEFLEWTTLIVPILKPDKTIWICGDYMVTLNPIIKLDNYSYSRRETSMLC